MSELVRKVSTRLYFLRQFKTENRMLLQESYFYFTSHALICSFLEYCSPVFIPLYQVMISYLSEDQERLQKRAMKILYPKLSYAKALELSALLTLYHRRETNAAKLCGEICANQFHRLHKLLPSKYQPSYSLREQRTFIRPKCKTERCKNSFLLSYVYSSWELDIILFLIVSI